MSPPELALYVRSRCVQDEDGCLIWRGALNNNGQPVMRLTACGTRDPRRVLWLASGRKLVRGLVFARPDCDPRCIEPEHQLYVTRKGAMRKASRDGRLSAGLLHAVRTLASQRRRPHVKLTMEIARAMRARYAETGNAALVAREFGVSHSHAHRVVRGVWWRDTTPFLGLGR